MVTRDFEITLRIPETTHIPTMFQVTQNDKDVYGLTVHITDGITEIDYSEVASATITFSKADGNVVQGDMAVGADSLTYTMGTNEIAHPGHVLASVQLFGAGGERLTTARFKFDVVADLITPSSVQSTSEYPILQRIVQDVEDVLPLIPGIEQVIEDFPVISDFFDTAAVSEAQRVANENTRQNQEAARQASIADIEERFNNLTASQQQDAEVIDARDGEASLNARLVRDKSVVDAHLANMATYTVGTWTAELKIDGTTVATATGYYYKIGDVYVIRIPTLYYTPESPITPIVRITIGGFPKALSDLKNHPIGGWIANIGVVALNGIYFVADNSLRLTTGNPIADYKPTIPTGDGCFFVGADIIG